MTVSLEHGLTDAQLRTYRKRGFVELDGLFSLDEVAQMRTEADRILELAINSSLALRACNDRLDLREAGGRQVVRKIQPVNDLSEFLTGISNDDRLLDPMRSLLGCEPLLMEEKLNFKRPLSQRLPIETRPAEDGFPFHHDWGYYRAQGYPQETLSSAVFLDECAPDSGPIRMVAGGHLREYPLGDGGAAPEIQEGVFTWGDAEDLLGSAGTAVVFHSKLVHHSAPNRTESHRRAEAAHDLQPLPQHAPGGA